MVYVTAKMDLGCTKKKDNVKIIYLTMNKIIKAFNKSNYSNLNPQRYF